MSYDEDAIMPVTVRHLPILFLATACFAQPSRDYSLPAAYSSAGEIASKVLRLKALEAGENYSFLLSLNSPGGMGASARVGVAVMEGDRVLLRKTLHMGDPDVYGWFRPARTGGVELRITAGIAAEATAGKYKLQINHLPAGVPVPSGPNHVWQDASAIVLGQVVFASNDEVQYLPLPETSRQDMVSAPAGEHWYRFQFDEPRPRLVFFQLELMDRDDLPVDVSIFREAHGQLAEYTEGQDPVTLPHEGQALPGNKFTPRVLREAGTYYVRVRANHPEYKLRTRVYELPPYRDPREAVRAAVDYIMGAGDSWFANTPRRGGALDRVNGVHQETSLCVACHASHFSQRAQLYAISNGYPLVQRQQLHFLEERFYNNPRPFYGFERQGAVWSRVISAPANVLSRISVLTSLFEEQVSGQARPAFHQGIAEYLKLYYAGRDKLPPDETNGNTPLVSAHEVAWYAWKTTHDVRLPEMIAQGEVKNMVDLCYQTLALAEIDRAKYAEYLRRNAERILALQRPSGQWSMKFEPAEMEVEFQTGHALWALAAAGLPADAPQVQKGIQYLLNRQQAFGGWMDPAQSFENFKTPFRETQFAVLALSTLYPIAGRAKGWDAARVESLSTGRVLTELDQIWDLPAPGVLSQIEMAERSNEVLIRQGAAEALGRLALPQTIPGLVALLNDPSKLVQRAAAWSLRQIYAAHPQAKDDELLAALGAKDWRMRWGATRVFAHHFATLAGRGELVAALQKLVSDPNTTVRMQAIRGLWQSWFWNADAEVRNGIEDTVLAALEKPQHPWVEQNLHAAIYNLADENIRYLYNNWVALLARPEDRDRAIRGRLGWETQLASKFAAILSSGTDTAKKRLLASLVDLPLRRGDVYDLAPRAAKPAPLVYSRIGNDIEQIAFFGASAAAVARALLPLMDSPDPELGELARKAGLMVRETPYAQVERAAGGRNESTLELGRKLDASPEASEVAKAFHVPPPKAPLSTPSAAAKPSSPAPAQAALDEPYFRTNIEPILQRKGADGYACVNCHGTHTLFNATWATVKNVVDRQDPENSLLLRKPIATAETEGVAEAQTTAHGGGQRWTKGSAEYETILKWIQGAR